MSRPFTMWLSCMLSMMSWRLHSTGSAHRISFPLPWSWRFLLFGLLLPLPSLQSSFAFAFPSLFPGLSLFFPSLPSSLAFVFSSLLSSLPFPLPFPLSLPSPFLPFALLLPSLSLPHLLCFSLPLYHLFPCVAFPTCLSLLCFALLCFAPNHITPVPVLACICSMHL